MTTLLSSRERTGPSKTFRNSKEPKINEIVAGNDDEDGGDKDNSEAKKKEENNKWFDTVIEKE